MNHPPIQPDLALQLATVALVALRNLNALSYVIDTLQRNVLPILQRTPVALRTKGLLSFNIAGHFVELGDWQPAHHWLDVAEALLTADSSLLTWDSDLGRVHQYRAIVNSCQGRYDLVAADLARASEIMERAHDVIGLSNNALYCAQTLLRQGQLDAVDDVLHSLHEQFTLNLHGRPNVYLGTAVTRQALGYLRVTLGELEAKMGHPVESDEHFSIAHTHFQQYRFVPQSWVETAHFRAFEHRMPVRLRLPEIQTNSAELQLVTRQVESLLRANLQ